MKSARIKKPTGKKENKYIKLFKILHELNQNNRKKIAIEDNCKIDNFVKNNDKNPKRPIMIEHFVKKETGITNFENSNLTNKTNLELVNLFKFDFNQNINQNINNEEKKNKKVYDSKDIHKTNFEKKFGTLNKKLESVFQNSTIKSSCMRSRKNINYRTNINSIYKKQELHSSLRPLLNLKDNFNKKINSHSQKEKLNMKNKRKSQSNLNLLLAPRRFSQKISSDFITKSQKYRNVRIKNRKILLRYTTKNRNTTDKLSISNYLFDNRTNDSISKSIQVFNDMKQINRFRQMRKDLSEERSKINHMMSSLFPINNQYNHKEAMIEILKKRNSMKINRNAINN
jgi:hypothetical protein